MFDVGLSCDGLVRTSPQRPCNDVSGFDLPLREPDRDASDFLNRPSDQELGGPCIPRFFFWGIVLFA